MSCRFYVYLCDRTPWGLWEGHALVRRAGRWSQKGQKQLLSIRSTAFGVISIQEPSALEWTKEKLNQRKQKQLRKKKALTDPNSVIHLILPKMSPPSLPKKKIHCSKFLFKFPSTHKMLSLKILIDRAFKINNTWLGFHNDLKKLSVHLTKPIPWKPH